MYTLGLAVLLACGGGSGSETGDTATRQPAPDGEMVYGLRCASCHGEDARGTGAGPTLEVALDRDDAVLVALILEGWGGMPPVVIPEADALAAIAYARSLF